MEKVCPRCQLPYEGIEECEYCGLQFSKYKNTQKENTLQKDTSSKSAKWKPYKLEDSSSPKKFISSFVSFVLIVSLATVMAYFMFKIVLPSNDGSGSSAYVGKGETATIKMRCYGAFSKASLERAFEISRSGDNKAFMEMMLSGQLVDIPSGTRVTVIDRTLSKAQVRIEGESSYIWIFSDWLN